MPSVTVAVADVFLCVSPILDSGSSPCKAECSVPIGIQGYIKLAAQGKYREALELIKNENPFPAVCGRICPRKCESACTRGDIDDPVAIDDIKKFIAEQELKGENRFVPNKKHDYGKKIAVVGAGPAGLSCAYYLAVDGYDITVLKSRKSWAECLPWEYLPSVLRRMSLMRKEGFEAFYLAIGAQGGRKLNIEGEEAEGVVTGVEFLRNVNLGEKTEISGKTLVIGGGNVAIDVARTAVRVGSDSVEMFCLENRGQMPALEEEIEEALSEDISINNSWGPKRIVTEKGKVTGVEFRKCLSVFDVNGRFSPTYDEGNTIIVPADHVLISVGQGIFWGGLAENGKYLLNPNGTIQADMTTCPDR